MIDINVKTKRPWFQIHLSTAVVLMFAAGGLIWVNLTIVTYQYKPRDDPWDEVEAELTFMRPMVLSVSIILSMLLLLAIWYVCEWWIRLGKAKS